VLGIVFMEISSPNEIPLWYGLTLCPMDGTVDYISQNIPAAGACPARLNATDITPESQMQRFVIEKALFTPNLRYHPIILRSSPYVSTNFYLVDSEGTTIFNYTSILTTQATPLSDPSNEDDSKKTKHETNHERW